MAGDTRHWIRKVVVFKTYLVELRKIVQSKHSVPNLPCLDKGAQKCTVRIHRVSYGEQQK